MAKRNAAVHAARRLPREFVCWISVINVSKVAHPLVDRTGGKLGAIEFEKSCWFAHINRHD
jgi:hypothetical protein